MAAIFTPTQVGSAFADFSSGPTITVYGTIALTGSYAPHGDTLSFSGFDQIKSNEPPLRVEIWENPAAGASASGFTLLGVAGTTMANGVIQVFGTGASAGAAGQELAASAYPAGLTGAVIQCRATFLNL